MLRNSKGYFLVDALIGLSIFIFVLNFMMPVLYRTYQERNSIREERFAIEVLNNKKEEWLSNEVLLDEVITYKNTAYQFVAKEENTEMQLCVKWTSTNKRHYEMCGKAK